MRPLHPYDLLFPDSVSEEHAYKAVELMAGYLKLEDDRILGLKRAVDREKYSNVSDYLRRNRVVCVLGYQLLEESVRRGYRTCVTCLLSYGILPSEKMLVEAVQHKHLPIVYDLSPFFTKLSLETEKLLNQNGFEDVTTEIREIQSPVCDNYDFDEMFAA